MLNNIDFSDEQKVLLYNRFFQKNTYLKKIQISKLQLQGMQSQKLDFWIACGQALNTYLQRNKIKPVCWFRIKKIPSLLKKHQFEMVYKKAPQWGTNIIQL